ncbi:MAG TPA: hypothetical protein VK721_11080 [Solirubrobacteraceae bacterium]|nr:hypothetical protein [Solirubrobacteraceae bacterium]
MIALLVVLMVVTLLVQFWPVVVAALALGVVWWGVGAWREARDRQAHERLRHARARQEIDAITFATARAMYQTAATADGEVIEGTVVEVER